MSKGGEQDSGGGGERKTKQKRERERSSCGKRAVFRLNPLKLQKYEIHVDSR